jgi:hypothetical protein
MLPLQGGGGKTVLHKDYFFIEIEILNKQNVKKEYQHWLISLYYHVNR